jgi:microsomal dipeptidase-like Zn-dependent dipeptidase
MRFFDAHCDTVLKTLDNGLDFVNGGKAHIDLPRLSAAGGCVQLFAVFMAQGIRPPDGDMEGHAERALATIHGWVATAGGRLRLALTAADIRAACGQVTQGSWNGQQETADTGQATDSTPYSLFPPPYGAVYALLGLEGADCLGGRAENLVHYFQLGVRNVIPAWGDNAFSGAALGEGGPLTAEGARLVEQCEALGVMVDVSHLSDSAFWQIHAMARRPFIASHSNCRALCPHSRNLTDEMIRAVAERGGVVGSTLAPEYLDPRYEAATRPLFRAERDELRGARGAADRQRIGKALDAALKSVTPGDGAWLARHVVHAIQVGGEDAVGLGGDLDGVSALPTGMTGVESYPALAGALLQAGLSESQVEKVCWRNMARVFGEVLPG